MNFTRSLAFQVFGMIFGTLSALGQTSESRMERTYPRQPNGAIEVNPLTALFSAIPGVGAFGGSVEGNVDGKWAAFVGASYADVKLSGAMLTRAKVPDDVAYMKSGYAYSSELGLRYYENPIGDSLFGGGSGSYSEMHGKWNYGEERFATDAYAFTPAIFAGYRWVWPSRLLLRLEGGLGVPRIDSKRVTDLPAAVSEGHSKVDKALSPVYAPRLGFSAGYSF